MEQRVSDIPCSINARPAFRYSIDELENSLWPMWIRATRMMKWFSLWIFGFIVYQQPVRHINVKFVRSGRNVFPIDLDELI
jgi:hypothetical protein